MKRSAETQRRSSRLKQQKSVQEDPISPTTQWTTSGSQTRQSRASNMTQKPTNNGGALGKGMYSMADIYKQSHGAGPKKHTGTPYTKSNTNNGAAHRWQRQNAKVDNVVCERSNGVENKTITSVAQSTGCFVNVNRSSAECDPVFGKAASNSDNAPVHGERKLSKEDSSDKEHSSLEQDALSLEGSTGPNSLEHADNQNDMDINMESGDQDPCLAKQNANKDSEQARFQSMSSSASHGTNTDIGQAPFQSMSSSASHGTNTDIEQAKFQSLPVPSSYDTNTDIARAPFQSMPTQSDMQGWAYAKSEAVNEEEVLLSADKLEIDAIITQNARQTPLPSAPPEVAADCPDFVGTKPKVPGVASPWPWSQPKKPVETNELFITHDGQTDSVLGDRFGAKLDTYQERDYNRHMLTHIEPGSPADKMKIQNNDEIVLFNNVFAPQWSHTEVLNRFHHLPVDGLTKFDLIIRRKETGNKKWQWYDSSAILAPDDRKYPNVTAISWERVPRNEKTNSVDMSYKIQGTNLWLELHTAGATVSPGFSGAEKVVRRSITISQDPNTGAYFYNCTLYGCACRQYVTIDANYRLVKMQENEPNRRFRYGRRSGICFSLDGLYLACKDDKKITVSESEYMFDEQPAHTGRDHPDHPGVDLTDNAGPLGHAPNVDQPDNTGKLGHARGVDQLDNAVIRARAQDSSSKKNPAHEFARQMSSNTSMDSGYGSGHNNTPDKTQAHTRKPLLRSNTAGLSDPLNALNVNEENGRV